MGYIKELINFIGKVDSLLEIGCGDRHNLNAYKAKYPNAKVEGCDLNSKSYCDIREKLSYKDKSFDVVLVAGVLLLIPGEIDHIIKELKRIGKTVILVDFHDLKERDFSTPNFVRISRNFLKWAKKIKKCRNWPGEEYPIKGSLIKL